MSSSRSDLEGGFTLVELLVAMLLLAVVLAIAGGLVIAATLGERTVRTVTGTSNSTQVAVEQMLSRFRAASAYRIDALGSAQFVQARVATDSVSGSTGWRCYAWYFDPTSGDIRTKNSTAAVPAPTATELSSWTLLASGVRSSGTASPAGSNGIFARTGRTIALDMSVKAGDQPRLTISTSATTRSDSWTGDTCFTAP
ncbi:prepilin-type N-terminal cleavage/methylation domain-containing protein [Galbitalea sp. SE-J8]|uniref:prepilin-type N-terminal cleavage/methylation domain-containing protein n=1 Tax=Galbitalea sp. SE-J8 TaxID=3054952 RepID=UPI00259CA54D|nr:prepilin-type N-terminal cleavage/methylation domain-containing protein [Galbitalea sp. SE-J8]MDM4761524.1 prepilin-type N-terminal cleavage/methylation domain-containing protein [Galbitalea sp. SE-J8]